MLQGVSWEAGLEREKNVVSEYTHTVTWEGRGGEGQGSIRQGEELASSAVSAKPLPHATVLRWSYAGA